MSEQPQNTSAIFDIIDSKPVAVENVQLEVAEELKQDKFKLEEPKPIEAEQDKDRLSKDYLKDLEKIKKDYEEARKWGTKNSQKLKVVSNNIKRLAQNGSINEEEANNILTSLDIERDDQVGQDPYQLAQIFKIANKELSNLRAYSDDDLFNKKVAAFDFFIKEASKEEIDEVRDELESLKDNPIKLTKRMIEIGNDYYNDIYKDYEESGGYKGTIDKYRQKLEQKEKELDKLSKKLAQYEDYTPTIGQKSLNKATGMSIQGEQSSSEGSQIFNIVKPNSERRI